MIVPTLKTAMTPGIQAGNDVQRLIVSERLCSDEPRALRHVKQAEERRYDQLCPLRAGGLRAGVDWHRLSFGARISVRQRVVGTGLDHFRGFPFWVATTLFTKLTLSSGAAQSQRTKLKIISCRIHIYGASTSLNSVIP